MVGRPVVGWARFSGRIRFYLCRVRLLGDCPRRRVLPGVHSEEGDPAHSDTTDVCRIPGTLRHYGGWDPTQRELCQKISCADTPVTTLSLSSPGTIEVEGLHPTNLLS